MSLPQPNRNGVGGGQGRDPEAIEAAAAWCATIACGALLLLVAMVARSCA